MWRNNKVVILMTEVVVRQSSKYEKEPPWEQESYSMDVTQLYFHPSRNKRQVTRTTPVVVILDLSTLTAGMVGGGWSFSPPPAPNVSE